jgi:ribosomal protein S12 methylthiotransferase accessory factor
LKTDKKVYDMEFPSSLNDNVKIRLIPGVSRFVSDSRSFFMKHNNQLFRLSSSNIEKRSRILDILVEPKKLIEITDILSEFRRNDLIAFLRNLYNHNLIEVIQVADGKKNTSGPSTDKTKFARFYDASGKYLRRLFDTKLLLIGDGVLANKLALYFKSMGLSCDTLVSSSAIGKLGEGLHERTQITIKEWKCSMPPSPFLGSSSSASLFDEYDLVIAAQDYPNIILFETINKISLDQNKPWLRVSFDDNIGYLGPLVVPGNTSCYNCCELRLIANSPYYEYYLWKYRDHIPKVPISISEIFADLLSAMCAEEVVRFLSNYKKPHTIDNLFVLDTQEMKLSKHKVIPYPYCMGCNSHSSEKQTQQRLFIRNTRAGEVRQTKRGTAAHSTLPENVLMQRLRRLLDEKTGIILRSEKLFENNVLGIKSHHFYYTTCSRPLRIVLPEQDDGTATIAEFHSSNNLIEPSPSGSGLTPTEAELSALMESVERYSSMLVDQSRLCWSAYNDVKQRAVSPVDLVLYPDEQFDRQDFRCSRFSPHNKIPWIQGWDLYSGIPVLVPADFVYYPPLRQYPLVLGNSNGAAAHTDLVQAVLNGLFEVIERDAFLVMWLNKLSMPILDVKCLPFFFNESLNLIKEFGLEVKLVDLTNDLNVPVVVAACYNRIEAKFPGLVVGAGAHLDPEVAIKKALFEMEFGLINVLEDPGKRKIIHPDRISASYEHPFVYLNPKMRKHWGFMISSTRKSVLTRSIRRSFKTNYLGSLKRIVRVLHSMNHRPVYVDITPPDINRLGLFSVKVLITGLQPLYFMDNARLNLERLLTVRRYLGSGKKVVMASELNYAPHPLP